MLGFLTLASPERVGFLDGKEELYGRADRVRFEAGRVGHIGGRGYPESRHQRADFLPMEEARFAALGIAELRRLRTVEEENRKLKQLVADLSLDKKMLQDVLSKKL
jgi:hypothetical protein